MRHLPRPALLTALCCAAIAVAAPAAQATGGLAELAGLPGCISDNGTGGDCRDGTSMLGSIAAVVSPDGRHVYNAAGGSYAVDAFSRAPADGTVTQLVGTSACVSSLGGPCATGYGFSSVNDIAISPDGKNVYAASFFSDSVTTFTRDPASGALSQPPQPDGCVKAGGDGVTCALGRGLKEARGVVVSEDGKFVYVMASFSGSVSTFSRNPDTGKLTQLAGADGCIVETPGGDTATCRDGHGLDEANDGGLAPGGSTLYAVAFGSDSVAVLDRDPATGILTQSSGLDGCVSKGGVSGCTPGRGLNSASDAAVSSDGKNVYATGGVDAAVAVFGRTADGDITQLAGPAGCVSNTGDGIDCADARFMGGANALTISPNGLDVYVAAQTDDSVVTLRRDPATGKLAQPAGPAGCLSETGDGGECADGHGVNGPQAVALSPDGANAYVPNYAGASLVILARGERPGCNDVTATAVFGKPAPVQLACADAGGDALTLSIVGAPAHGTLGAVNATGGVTYTPAANFYGTDSFTYRAVAEDGSSNVATATVQVAGPTKCKLVKTGTAAKETITGTPFGDVLKGLAGNDKLKGLAGNDCLNGGAGRDKLSGGAGDDKLAGSSDADSLSGGDGKDKLSGGSGDDRLNGGTGKNSYSGGSGNDQIGAKNKTNEKIDCGQGRDRVVADKGDKLKGCEIAIRGK